MDLKINTYLAISLDCQPQKTKESKDYNSAVADSAWTGNFMAVSAHVNNMWPTTNIINENFPNGQKIISTMKGE